MVFDRLWKSSHYHICADGGANRLMDATYDNHDTTNNNNNTNSYIPNAIRGDLDSLREDTRLYFESHGVEIEKDPDQDSNDLDKALHKIMSISQDFDQIIIYGAFGGRFDQEMASFQALYKWAPKFANRIWLYSDETLACLIPSNCHVEIQIPHAVTVGIREGPTCGLIPLGFECKSLSTTGFKWNLEGAESAFGGLVSTSNCIIDEVVGVEASHPLVFTAEVVVCQQIG
jgi:thiamine pyrophosphokinase